MNKNTKENILIAKFIGMQKTDIGWFDNEGFLLPHTYNETDGNCHDLLHFHESWDWLMSAVEVLKHHVQREEINHLIDDVDSSIICVDIDDANVNIITAITWYNEHDETNNLLKLKIRNLIARDGDEYSDGEVIDDIVELLNKDDVDNKG